MEKEMMERIRKLVERINNDGNDDSWYYADLLKEIFPEAFNSDGSLKETR